MIGPGNINMAQVAQVAQHGSPGLLAAVGRLYGLGQAERNALAKTGVPGWALLGLGVAAGFVIGARVQKRWPDKVPELIGG